MLVFCNEDNDKELALRENLHYPTRLAYIFTNLKPIAHQGLGSNLDIR